MTDNELLDLYSDDLISSFRPTTAAGRATLFDQEISHDRGQRLVAGTKRRSSDPWQIVRSHRRAMQQDDGVRIRAARIAEQPAPAENDRIGWQYDHTQGRSAKGITFSKQSISCSCESNTPS